MFSHKRKKGSRLVAYDEKEPVYLYEDAEKRDLAGHGDDLFPSVPKDYRAGITALLRGCLSRAERKLRRVLRARGINYCYS